MASRLTYDESALRERWRRTDSAAYDAATAAMARALLPLDAPLLALCRGRVLELAVGTGRFLRQIAAQPGVTQAFGVDLAPQMLKAAQAGGARLLVLGAAEALPFAAASFDTLACTFYSMRDMDRPRVYAEAARVLRPGGRFGFTLRNFYLSWLETFWQAFVRRGRWPRSCATLDGVDAVTRDVRDARLETRALAAAGLRLVAIRSVRFVPFLRRLRTPGYWSGAWASRLGADIIFIAERMP
jgi:SAM-dependent methyltransferase